LVAGPKEINAMKRVPPSVRLKEEIEGLLGAAETAAATEEPPMAGSVGRLARYMLQVAIEAEATSLCSAKTTRGNTGSRFTALAKSFPHLRKSAGKRISAAVSRGRAIAEAEAPKVRRRARKMSAAASKAVSDRMKKYWAQRRKTTRAAK
jgi:hypothetical protein